MGWCGGTEIFDTVADIAITKMPRCNMFEVLALLKALIRVLEDHDWDNQCESDYYDHPLVKQAFEEVNKEWEARHDNKSGRTK